MKRVRDDMRRDRLATSKPRTDAGQALSELCWTVLDVYFHMRAPADRLTEHHGQSAPRYGVLRDLAIGGPMTVAQMAGARGQARQSVQLVTDELCTDGLIEYIENPAHRRSKLARLTPAGWTVTLKIAAREAVGWDNLAGGLNARQLRVATRVLKRLKQRFRRPRRGGHHHGAGFGSQVSSQSNATLREG